jgi:peptidoglycan hydrolase-like protein with peptidoglycan-binding domain
MPILDGKKLQSQPQRRTGSGLAAKLSIAAGSLSAIYGAPTVAEASPIGVTGSPVSLSIDATAGTTVAWDVDGDSVRDFELFLYATTSSSYRSIFLNSSGLNGRGLVAPSGGTDVQALLSGFGVGPTLANYAWGSGSYAYRNALSSYNSSISVGYNFAPNGFADAVDGFFGFRFDKAGQLHYGWAVINVDTAARTVTIDRWAYESQANTGIAVPEPATSSLVLLGLGALGVRGWRARRRAEREKSAEAADA